MAARTVRDTVVSVRSKNAGPFTVTFDLFFPDRETFDEVTGKQVINPDVVADLYNLEPSEVKIFPFVPALAIKVSVPRLMPGGAPGDTDVAGGQQFVPLLSIPVP
jgi:hypothetical protein